MQSLCEYFLGALSVWLDLTMVLQGPNSPKQQAQYPEAPSTGNLPYKPFRS